MFSKKVEVSRTEMIAVRLMDQINAVGRKAIPNFKLALSGFRLVVLKTEPRYHGKFAIDRIAGWHNQSTIMVDLLPKDGWYCFENASLNIFGEGSLEFFGEDRGCDSDFQDEICWINFHNQSIADFHLNALLNQQHQISLLYQTNKGYPEPTRFFPTLDDAREKISATLLNPETIRCWVGARLAFQDSLETFLYGKAAQRQITGTSTSDGYATIHNLFCKNT